MKLLCTASKVSWFTVGREYDVDVCSRVREHDGAGSETWPIEPHNGGYRTERLEDAEFSVVLDEHEDILAAVVQMADEEGCRKWFDYHLRGLRLKYDLAEAYEGSQRGLLLALAYFAEEKSQ